MFKVILSLIVSVNLLASSSYSQVVPDEKCNSIKEAIYQYGNSEDCYDLKYSLLSYLEADLFKCKFDNDDRVIVQYIFERVRICQEEEDQNEK